MTNDGTAVSAAVRERLETEYVVWLTTVNASGEPTPTPVWFLWAEPHVWIRSQPTGAKITHVAANPHVALNLNADRTGGDVVVLNGTGTIEETMPDETWAAYARKYAIWFDRSARFDVRDDRRVTVTVPSTPARLSRSG